MNVNDFGNLKAAYFQILALVLDSWSFQITDLQIWEVLQYLAKKRATPSW